MNGWRSKIRSVQTYDMTWTVYFDWICSSGWIFTFSEKSWFLHFFSSLFNKIKTRLPTLATFTNRQKLIVIVKLPFHNGYINNFSILRKTMFFLRKLEKPIQSSGKTKLNHDFCTGNHFMWRSQKIFLDTLKISILYFLQNRIFQRV